jgi:hypothetical protein
MMTGKTLGSKGDHWLDLSIVQSEGRANASWVISFQTEATKASRASGKTLQADKEMMGATDDVARRFNTHRRLQIQDVETVYI